MAKRSIDTREFRKDITSGMDEYDLMRKHGVSQTQLQRVLRKMMLAGLLSESELLEWLSPSDRRISGTSGDEKRNVNGLVGSPVGGTSTPGRKTGAEPGHQSATGPTLDSSLRRIGIRLLVSNLSDSGRQAILRDLSTREFRLASQHPHLFQSGAVKTLAISTDPVGEPEPIVVQARCKWFEKRSGRKDYYVGGFEVTRLSDQSLQRIKRLMGRLDSDRFSGKAERSGGHRPATPPADVPSTLGSETFDSELTEELVRTSQGFRQPSEREWKEGSAPQFTAEGPSAGLAIGANGIERRRWPRNYLTFSVPVHEAGIPDNKGLIENISERGIGVTGIIAMIHETKALVIQSGQEADVSFEAICRWSAGGRDGDLTSGFEITRISEEALADVRDLIHGPAIGR